MMQQIIEELNGYDGIGDYWTKRNWIEKYQKEFPKIIKEFTADENAHIEDLLIVAVRNGGTDVMTCFAEPILERRKLIDWKNRADLIDRVYDVIIEAGCLDDEEKNRHYSGFLEKFVEVLETYQIAGRNHEKILEVLTTPYNHLDKPDLPINTAAMVAMRKYPWVEHPEGVQVMAKLLWKSVDYNPDLSDSHWLHTTAGLLFHYMFCYQSGTSVHMSILEDVTKIFIRCTDFGEFQSDEDPKRKNLAYAMLKSIMEEYLSNGTKPAQMIKPMMPCVKKLWECSDSLLRQRADYIMTANAGNAELMGETTDALLDKFFKTQDSHVAMNLSKIYEEQPDLILSRLSKFHDILKLGNEGSDYIDSQIMTMFGAIAKKNPQQFPADIISTVITKLPGVGTLTNTNVQAVQIADALAGARPADVLVHEKGLIASYESNEPLVSMTGAIFEKLATDEAHQRKYLNMFAARLGTVTPGTYQLCVIMNMRKIGLQCPKILGEHRALIESLKEQVALKDYCQSTLDVIDGRTLEGVANDVNAQHNEIVQLDTRITSTEGDVTTIKADVQENKKDIAVVRSDVANQGEKLDQLKVVVDETVERVDELERKTLSHAPAWSRDVAKLLNPQTDCDWRLLSTRLGYLPEDVRNWATQPDPCLSMLDEWFATHKTREATHAIRKTLVEMNRTDASTVVDRALKAVEHVISNNDEEPADPPPIFLSYQWAIQQEVKLLRRHLGLSGYASWMDIGQMGGGDKLFAKIDAGIRAAKVVVCCVTSKYAESPNCNREVNLAITLGKPIIPLLIEKMSWPPPGSMGPIFGEYIFVRFFQRDGEATKDDRYWPADKFTELLFQLRYSIAPEIDAIPEDSMYQNWWRPPQEVIAIKPKNASTAGLPAVEVPETISKPAAAPEVFISYQWDKQPQIKELYRRLTELGFSCWLDVLQMGGGDSLFDKIDRGVRGCKVVISCVTSKYSMSANCRREVSLADALKRPIIPLRLEAITWPPEGPMSLVFTQMLYVDFTKPSTDVQNKWNCLEFYELVQKLVVHVPKEIKSMTSVSKTGSGGRPKQPTVQTTRYYN